MTYEANLTKHFKRAAVESGWWPVRHEDPAEAGGPDWELRGPGPGGRTVFVELKREKAELNRDGHQSKYIKRLLQLGFDVRIYRPHAHMELPLHRWPFESLTLCG